jgi:hypothetical protein
MIYKNSSSYSEFNGSWIEGEFNDGTLIFKDGDSFKGFFMDGKYWNGTLTFANGCDYHEREETKLEYLVNLIENEKIVKSDLLYKEFKGVWHDHSNSEGTLLYESGSKYEGQLK